MEYIRDKDLQLVYDRLEHQGFHAHYLPINGFTGYILIPSANPEHWVGLIEEWLQDTKAEAVFVKIFDIKYVVIRSASPSACKASVWKAMDSNNDLNSLNQ